jgi:diadenosine tetraphosphatase ApaH/serine/threonine PP2A family protein phosphatase
MRLALLTDVHANRQALAACLAHAGQQGVDQYAFLGDLVGYGADPEWVVDTVMEHVARGAVAVQGNHDAAVALDQRPHMHPETLQAIEWTRARLGQAQLDFLAGLALTRHQGNLLFAHANAHDPGGWEYVTGVAQAEHSLRASHGRMLFCGHVHGPALYRRADDGRMGSLTPDPGQCVGLQPQHQYLAIPGAVGQPRDGNNAACYAIYDDQGRQLCFHRVPYDHGAAARSVIAAGLPLVFAMRLIEGI